MCVKKSFFFFTKFALDRLECINMWLYAILSCFQRILAHASPPKALKGTPVPEMYSQAVQCSFKPTLALNRSQV